MAERKRIRLEVASPCTAKWEDMEGDDAVRFCGTCRKNVYELSNMTTDAIEELLRTREEVCASFYQRRDGTVLTGDCPPGRRRRRRKQLFVGLGAGALSAVGVAFAAAPADHPQRTVGETSVEYQPMMGAVEPDPAMVEEERPARIRGGVRSRDLVIEEAVPTTGGIGPESIQVIDDLALELDDEPSDADE